MPLRSFGGAPYSALPNEAGNPPFRLLGTAAWSSDDEMGAKINAAAEGAVTQFWVPRQWKDIARIRLFFRNDAVDVLDQNVAVRILWSRCTWLCYSLEHNATDVIPFAELTGADALACLDLVPPWDSGDIAPGGWILIKVLYAAAGGGRNATNCVFVGAIAMES